MVTTAAIAEIGALVGDPARAATLHALMDGRALTATELACVAGIAPQTASGHLTRMVTAGLLAMERQGRHRYHRLASARVARLIEDLMMVAADGAADGGADGAANGAANGAVSGGRLRTGPRDPAMRLARTCYDHIAGRLGVALTAAMVRRGHIELADDAGIVTASGAMFLDGLGLVIDAPPGQRRTIRALCRPCLDWSERRPHLAGRLGAALCAHCLARGWVRRRAASRALDITPAGDRAFRDLFGFARAADEPQAEEPQPGESHADGSPHGPLAA